MSDASSTALIERVYDAVLADDGWATLMCELVDAFDSTQAALLSQDNRSGVAQVRAHIAGVSDKALRDYETYYGPRSPLFHHFKLVPLGVPYTDADYPDQAVYRNSEIYNDFYRPLDAEHLLGVDLKRSAGLSTYLIVRRSDAAGFFTTEHSSRFAQLGRHLSRALRFNQLMEDASAASSALEAVLTHLPGAVLVTDAAGRVAYLNPRAERLATSGDGFRIRQGHLHCLHPADRNALDRLINRAGNGHPMDEGGTVTLRRRSSALPLMVEVIPLPASCDSPSARPLVMVRMVEHKRRAPAAQTIACVLDLTPAEAGVVAALCGGESVAEHATRSGISLHTARTLLRNAMAKTETHRQAELVSLVLSIL